MASMKMSGCMKLVSRMSQADQDLLLARLDQYQADGVPAERAQFMAAQDTLAEVQGERTQLASLLREQHPDLFVVTGGAKLSRTRAPESKEFKRWFGESVVVDEQGQPLVVYHGTQNEFDEFSLNYRREDQGNDQFGPGYYSTTSATGAGGYAYGEGANIKPLYVRIENPIDLDTPAFGRSVVERLLRASPDFDDALMNFGDVNYEGERKVLRGALDGFEGFDSALQQLRVIQGDFWSGNEEGFLKAAKEITGHDGVVVDNGGAGKFFVAWTPNQLKSATGNSGEYSLDDNRITKSSSRTDTPEFKAWFGDSKIVNEDGTPKVMYHATHRSFDTFANSFRGALFVTPEPEFANEFIDAKENESDEDNTNIMPLYVKAENPFDYDNPEHVARVIDYLHKTNLFRGVQPGWFEGGRWDAIEDRNVQKAIKALGFDSFYVSEFDTKNLGVYERTQLKSAIGNNGDFDATNPNITKSTSRAPEWVPQNIWDLHEKLQRAEDEANGRADTGGKAPGALKRNETMAFRRLNKAAEDYFGGDAQKAEDLMVRMNQESNRRADEDDIRFSRTRTPEFKRWSKNLPLVEADYSGSYNGGPAVFEAFHGTTHDDITEFQVVGNKEGALGAGPYMSTSVDDVNENYAGVGPDLTNRIGREEESVHNGFHDDPWFATQVLEDYFAAEGIDQEVTDDNIDELKDEYGDAAITHAATARLKGKSDGLVMPVYVRMEKPFNMATNPTYFEMTYPEDENGEPDYEAEPEGSAMDLINAINEVASWYGADAESLTAWVYENAADGVSAREVFDRAAKDMEEIYDAEGEMLSSGQFIQEVAREMGFDGLIQDADLYFGTQRRGFGGIRAGAMKGVRPGTLHLMPFDGTQVKSATGNNGDYSDSRDITKSTRRTDTPEFKRWAETNGSVIKDANGQPLVLYRGGVGDKELSENFLNAEPRPGYATFASSSPFVANSYANPEAAFDSEVGAVAPLYVKAKRLIEFTVGRRFDKFEFDRRARTLQPGEVLVARQVYDYGPRASSTVDPEKLYSYPSDIFAWRSAAVKSATGNSGAFSDDNSDTRFSKQRIVGESSRKYTPEQLAMFKNTGRTVEVPTIKERIASLRKDFGKKMAQGLADQFRPLKDLSKEAYALARLSKGAAGAFEAFLHHGKLKITDNVYDAENTGGFIERLGVPLHGELEDFMWWTAANRAKRLKAEGRENLFSDADIQAGLSLDQGTTDYDYTIQNGPEKGKVTRDRTKIFRDAQVIFNEFNKNALDMAEQSGLIDGESRKLWENEFYIPFYRVSEEDGGFIGAKIGQPLVRQRAFKMLKGGTDKLNSDLLANTLQNWGHLIDAAAKNRAAKASLEAAANVGVAIESNETTVRQLGKALAMRKNVVWFMDQGKERYFLVEDPHVLAAITSLEFAGMRGPLMDALSKFKHYLTIGVTASPAFKIRNLIRDSLQAVATAPLSYNVAGNLKEGFKATDRKGQDYVSMLASGALIRFGTMEGSRADQTRRLIKQGVKDSTILDSESKVKAFYDKYLEPGIAAYQELGNRGEEINRAALYKQLIKQGKSHQEASLMARDLMDFSMQGTFTSVRFLTQVVPFMNARIQGLYKLGRATKEDQARMAMVIGATALASIALMAAYADDDDWKKREDWDRNNNWWFKFGGVAFRIPKPFEIGAVATMAERGLEYFTSKEMTGKRLGQNYWHILMDNLSMNPVPQAVKPIIDVYSNKDSFSGRPIETMGMEKLKSQYRYTQNTSMVARGLSTATFGALSPVQFDHVMRGYFGWLGSFVVSGADYAIRPLTNEATRPQGDYWKMATAGIVSETGGASSRYVSQMYDQAKVLEEAYGTYRSLLKEGKTAEAKEFFQANKEDLTKYRSVERVKQAEAKFNERIRMIERSAMDPAVKKEKIREIQVQKDRVARLVAPGLR